jgi:hypothetical protein
VLKRNIVIALSILTSTLLISLVDANAFASHEQDFSNFYSGPIASSNDNWILSGHWMGYINQSSPKDSVFHSMFNMVMTNGSAPHIHKIGNATAISVTKEGNNTAIEGNVSITMKDGPISNIPTIVTIANNNSITILPNPSKVNNHFGNATINGLVSNDNNTAKITEMMTTDTEVQQKLSPIINMIMMNNMLKDAMAKGNFLDNTTGMTNMTLVSP